MFEGLFSELEGRYGEEFHWMNIKDKQEVFIKEFYSELKKGHPLYQTKITAALAKSGANDDVLFLSDDGSCIIVHLTWSKANTAGFPRYKEFAGLQDALKYIENEFVTEYL